MTRVAVLIDGFNLYHALDYSPDRRGRLSPHRYKRYKWLNLKNLANLYATIELGDTLESVHYFTALAHWDSGKVSRHQLYINALKDQGVEVVFGEFKRKLKHCNVCKRDFPRF